MNNAVPFMLRAVAAIVVGLVMAGCSYYAITGKHESYLVKLDPKKGSNELVVKLERGRSCQKNKHFGCMLFKRDYSGTIKFYLPGSRKMLKTCEDKGVTEVITRIELTNKGVGGADDATKGIFNGGLPEWLKKRAFPDLDTVTGFAYDETVDTGATLVILDNLNSTPAREGTQPFWYRVTVTDCDGSGNSYQTDPRGDNEGTKLN
jgi:hypothetical protein